MAIQARPLVFINHGENDLSDGFIRHLASALRDEGFNVFIDSDERRGRGMEHIFRAIDNSKVALVIFSDRYTASELCLHEAVRIYDRRREGKLVLIPVFYRVSTDDVNMFNGRFGESFLETLKIQGISDHPFAEHWMRNVNFICTDTGYISEDYSSNDTSLVVEIVRGIKRRLQGKKLPRRVQDENLPSIFKMFMPKQPNTQEGFGKELLYVAIPALLCYFILPLVFTDLDVFSIRQLLVAVL
ncbi:unnamed protein product, partial [Arabidopsis lyrata]